MKTPEGRRRNQETKKRKHETKRAAKAAKTTQEQSGSPEARQTKQIKKDRSKKGSTEDKEAEESIPSDSANVASATEDPSTNSADPPHLLTELENTHDVTSINVISSSHIQQKVTRALEILSEYPTIPPAKPKVVVLHSKASVASKMITIAEIAKREIVKNGGKWYQYNKLSQVVEERKESEQGMKEKNGDIDVSMAENGGEDDGQESEEEFETMKTPFERAIEGKPKIRAIPVMTVYLSRLRIDNLRKDHT
jgi:hypothetical protein